MIVFIVIWVLFWTCCTLGLDYEIGEAVLRQHAARRYSTATGTIIESEVTRHYNHKRRVSYGLKLKYRYQVAGRAYTGTRYRYGDKHDWDRSAYDLVKCLREGSAVTVFYNPADPADSLLTAGLEGRDLFALLFLVPFNMIVVVSWYGAARSIKRKLAPPLAAGVRIFRRDTHIAVRLPEVSPWSAALGIGFALSFASMLVIGIGVGTRPPWLLMVAVWCCLVLAMVWAYWKQTGNAKNLLIDWFGRQLQLPHTFGRREDVVVPLAAVEEVTVTETVRENKKGPPSRSYLPTLVWRNASGELRRDTLAKYYNRREAGSLVEWLREQLRRRGGGFDAGFDAERYAAG